MADTPTGDDNTTTSATSTDRLLCPICWTEFTRIRRQRYCSATCRKTAWTRRQAATTLTDPVPPPIRRGEITLYSGPARRARYHGEQWCYDCNQPCTRTGIGGLCPHSREPVAVTDPLDTPPPTPTNSKITR